MRSYNEGDFNSIQSAETVEKQYPLRVEACEIREGSCGDGEFRGGFGLRRDIRILGERAMLSVLSEKNVIPPYGVKGGSNGAANKFTVIRNGKQIEPSDVPGKVSGFELLKNDIVREETAGGGGFGDPFNRDASRVRADMVNGLLTESQAASRYGVILEPDGSVNEKQTVERRQTLREERLKLRVQVIETDEFDGVRRIFQISDADARLIGIQRGDLIEIRGSVCAPVRGWAELNGTSGVIALHY